MRLSIFPIIAFALASSIQAPAIAGEREEAAADMIACTALKKNKDRLKCFERGVSGLRAAFPESQALAEARAEAARSVAVEEAKEEFGLPAAVAKKDDPVFEEDFGARNLQREATLEHDDDGDIKSLTSGVIEVGRNLRGKIIVILENGQVWTQINADSSRPYIPKKLEGVTATIKKGALGSYRLRVSSARGAFKVRRIK